MRLDSLSKHFESMGARVKFGDVEHPDWWGEHRFLWEEKAKERARRRLPVFTIDIADDRKGPYFDIRVKKGADIGFDILQSLPKDRHLLMMTSRGRRFLCGHDERHWFVAEVRKRVSSIRDARRALLPQAMQHDSASICSADLSSRKNGIFKRQGEWFFVPVEMKFDESIIHREEPIQRRLRSKPHICEQLVREGGETTYLIYGREISKGYFSSLKPADRRRVSVMTKNPRVYVRGHVRHPDHRTIYLDNWHHVLLNSERTTRNLAFLD